MPQGFTDRPYLTQIPKADMDDRIFPMAKFYFSVIYGWFASLFFSCLLTGRDHPLGKAFSLKGFKVAKEKLQFFPGLGVLFSDFDIRTSTTTYNPDRLHGLEPKLSTNSESLLD